MTKIIRKAVFIMAFCASSMMMTSTAMAQEWPMVAGDYWEVAAIDIKDGGGLKYANWLADEWRKNADFAKMKGWIKDYKILSNVHGRKGEASIYLIRIMENIPSGADGEQRAKDYVEWRKKSVEQMQAESGNRAEYREVISESLLQELNFRD